MLKELDIIKLKSMNAKQRTKKVDEFEKKKETLIRKYIEFQDVLDEYKPKSL